MRNYVTSMIKFPPGRDFKLILSIVNNDALPAESFNEKK